MSDMPKREVPKPNFTSDLLPGGGSGRSDLLDRIGKFLPQIDAANKDLLSSKTEASQNNNDCMDEAPPSYQIDEGLTLDIESGSDSDDEDDLSEKGNKSGVNREANTVTEEEPGKETIELKVALGDFDKSKIALLEEHAQNSHIAENNGGLNNGGNQEGSENMVKNMLLESDSESKKDASKSSPKKKVLIQEIG